MESDCCVPSGSVASTRTWKQLSNISNRESFPSSTCRPCGELNLRPSACKTSALPLSYVFLAAIEGVEQSPIPWDEKGGQGKVELSRPLNSKRCACPPLLASSLPCFNGTHVQAELSESGYALLQSQKGRKLLHCPALLLRPQHEMCGWMATQGDPPERKGFGSWLFNCKGA